MAELNFIIDQTALDTVKNTTISANFDEMKEALTEFAEPYKHVIVSEDAIGIAKADRARIRSVSSHIDSYRKAVKNVYTEPLKAFEAKCKELTAICDEAAQNIDTQVKAYEQKRKEEKLFLLRDYFDNQQKNMKYPEFIEWETIQNPKWANTTYSVENAHKDIDIACMGTDRDVQQIVDLSSEFQLSLLNEYKRTHNVFDAFHLQERLAAEKKKEEERQAEMARRKAEAEARAKAEAEARAKAKAEAETVPNDAPVDMPELNVEEELLAEPEPVAAEPRYITTLQVEGTAREVSSLENLLKTLRVPYRILSAEAIGERNNA